MGKYSHLKGTLAKFNQDPSFQQKVDQIRKAYVGQKLADLTEQFRLTDALKKDHQAKISDLNVKLESLQQEILERFENEDTTSMTFGPTKFYVKDTPYVSLVDRLAFFKWVKENKMGDLFTINYQTTAAVVKEMLIEGKPLPPGIKTMLKSSVEMRTRQDV